MNRNILNLQLNAMHFPPGHRQNLSKIWVLGGNWMGPFYILKFRNRIMNMDKERITGKVYAWSLSLAGLKFPNWTGRLERY